MSAVRINDAETASSDLVDDAGRSGTVTTTHHSKLGASLVSIEAAGLARKALGKTLPGLVAYLRTFPGGEVERDRSPSRDANL